ncbi:MAG: hypothetical protein JY451_04945 [Erythrobacter sp.]|nr:MAG: hypothetical protein JY451_04945 [Erythrobacter sp.]
MREDCSQYETAREAREDSLISTVIQITSASLLGVPGLIFGVEGKFPDFSEAYLLYIGLICFLLTLIAAMGEQYLSGIAYKRRAKIAQEYYLKKSVKTSDPKFSKWLVRCQNAAYLLFIISLSTTAVAIVAYGGKSDGRSEITTTIASSSSSSSPATTSTSATAD